VSQFRWALIRNTELQKDFNGGRFRYACNEARHIYLNEPEGPFERSRRAALTVILRGCKCKSPDLTNLI
jgi:hypothetical protein